MNLDEKIRLIVELTGWSEGKALTECVRCIPEEYIEPDGQRNTEHTEEGADAVLARLRGDTRARIADVSWCTVRCWRV